MNCSSGGEGSLGGGYSWQVAAICGGRDGEWMKLVACAISLFVCTGTARMQ